MVINESKRPDAKPMTVDPMETPRNVPMALNRDFTVRGWPKKSENVLKSTVRPLHQSDTHIKIQNKNQISKEKAHSDVPKATASLSTDSPNTRLYIKGGASTADDE